MQDFRNTSDNSNNDLLSLDPQTSDNSDDDGDEDYIVYNPDSKSDLSNHNRVFDQGSNGFNGDTEDTSTYDDSDDDLNVNNAGDSSNSGIVYDPGGIRINNNSIPDGPTRDRGDDFNYCHSNNSLLSKHTASPFDNDVADNQHSNDRGRATELGTTDTHLGLFNSDDHISAYDPGGDNCGDNINIVDDSMRDAEDNDYGNSNGNDSSRCLLDSRAPSLLHDTDNRSKSSIGDNRMTDADDSRSFGISIDSTSGDFSNVGDRKHAYDPGGNRFDNGLSSDRENATISNDGPSNSGNGNIRHDPGGFGNSSNRKSVHNPGSDESRNGTKVDSMHDNDDSTSSNNRLQVLSSRTPQALVSTANQQRPQQRQGRRLPVRVRSRL